MAEPLDRNANFPRKASKVFHKLPNGQWGLVDWYDNIRKQKAEAKNGDKGNGNDIEDDDGDGVDVDDNHDDEKGGDENEES